MATARTFGGVRSVAVCSTREPQKDEGWQSPVHLQWQLLPEGTHMAEKAVTAATWLCLGAIAQRARVVYLSARSRACAVRDAVFTALSKLVGQALSAS